MRKRTDSKIRILHVGDFRFDFYDQALFREFQKNDQLIAEKFEVAPYFSNYTYNNLALRIRTGLQNRYKVGPLIRRINSDLIKHVGVGRFDIVFLWRGVHFLPASLAIIKSTGVKIFGYNNDSTFSKRHPYWLFYLLKRQIPFYDHYYAYRPSDIDDYRINGTQSSLFLPTFDPTRTYPLTKSRKEFDLVFIGHFENDGRDVLFLKLSKLGWQIGLYGQGWRESPIYSELRTAYGDISPAYDDYNNILNSSKIALTLLSQANSDTYTRRSIEIPATGTAMLAPRTQEHIAWFRPDREAFYFTNYGEIPSILERLMANPSLIREVAAAGYSRVIEGNFQLKHRVAMIIQDYFLYTYE